MANILLGVTGSVAAIKTPDMYHALRHAGHVVRIVATRASLYFFDPYEIGVQEPVHFEGLAGPVVFDEDEWPGREQGRRYRREDPVLHINLRRWADLLAIAPLDANTLAKLAAGLADNCLTCVWRAWDPARPVVLAPAMNTLMWEHPLTVRHLRQLASDAGATVPEGLDAVQVAEWINRNCPRLRVVGPVSKQLACGDVGIGGMAGIDELVRVVEDLVPRA